MAGVDRAIEELKKIEDNPAIRSYHLLYSTMAEFYMQSNKLTEAAEYLKKAINLSLIQAEKELLQKKLDLCNRNIVL